MKHDGFEGDGIAYSPCRYGLSRIQFRGPRRSLDDPYYAFIGGTEIFGKFNPCPLPDLVEKAVRMPCVNFGCVNGGVDAFVNDPTIMAACNNAAGTVVQVMGANFMSNRFYSVHPRRNDRFLRPSTVMQAIYNDVDFSEFTFTRAMLAKLLDTSSERFDIVVQELREAWSARMKNMLDQIGPKAVLLWFSRDGMSDDAWDARPNPIQSDPLFITATMIDGLRPQVAAVIEANPSEEAMAKGTKGMVFPQLQAKAAARMLGPACHVEASKKVTETLLRIERQNRAA